MAPTVSDNIRAEMARQRMSSQGQLGERIGMSQRAVSRRLAGETEWSALEVLAVARALGVEVAVFYEGVEPAEPAPQSGAA